MFLMLVALLSARPAWPQAPDEKEVLREIENAWHKVYITQDARPLETILADSFVHINRLGQKSFKKDAIAGVREENTAYEECYPYDLEIDINGTTAVVVGKSYERGTASGKPFERRYFWTDVFVRRNNRWECTLAQTAPLPAPRVYFGDKLSEDDSAIAHQTHDFLKDLSRQDRFSGVVFILKNGAPLYKGSFGNASKEHNVPNAFDTRFNLASMTKMFTGIAVAQLVEQKRLRFEDLVSGYLPGVPVAVIDGITVHQLLTHTSGLGSFWTGEFHNSNHAAYRTLADYLPLIKNDRPQFKPGTGWAYSNTGYLLLGLIVERISGMTYFDFVKKHVFEKAGMTSADFCEADLVNRNVASSYTRQNRYLGDTTSYSSPVFIAPVKGSPAGGAYASATDLMSFCSALSNHSLLSAENTEAVLAGKVPYGRPDQRKSYGHGFANQVVNGRRIVFHDGAANGISTGLDIYPELGFAVIVLCNYDDPLGRDVITKTRSLIAR
jgi:CubicO group peptidase (beta-lactamase class C family)